MSKSSLQGACRQAVSSTLTGTLKVTGSDISDLIPHTIEDVQHFADLVFAIRNPVFGLPMSMMYSKFRYVIRELATISGSTSLLYLDPEIDVSLGERFLELKRTDRANLLWCENIQVHTVGNSAEDVLRLPIGASNITTESDIVGFEAPVSVEIELKRHFLHTVETESQRVEVLRLLAAESDDLAPRTSLLLTDLAVPLLIINGCNTTECVKAVANAVTLQKRYNLASKNLSQW